MELTVKNKFIAALERLLKERGVKQTELARKLEISKQHLHNILKGRRCGSDEVREKIARFFGLTFEEMLSLGAETIMEEKKQHQPQPFLRYYEIIALPKEKRFDAIVEVAQQQTACPFVVFDPALREKYARGEISEQEVYEAVKRHMETIRDAVVKKEKEEKRIATK